MSISFCVGGVGARCGSRPPFSARDGVSGFVTSFPRAAGGVAEGGVGGRAGGKLMGAQLPAREPVVLWAGGWAAG